MNPLIGTCLRNLKPPICRFRSRDHSKLSASLGWWRIRRAKPFSLQVGSRSDCISSSGEEPSPRPSPAEYRGRGEEIALYRKRQLKGEIRSLSLLAFDA